MKCADCKFWRPYGPFALADEPFAEGMGECHRHAPTGQTFVLAKVIGALCNHLADNVREDGDATAGTASAVERQNLWPVTDGDDFCGDYAAGKSPGFV